MRAAYVTILAIALSLGTFMGPAVAEHNSVVLNGNVGADTSGNGNGAPFPTPQDEPNTPDGLRPVYHVAEPDNDTVSGTYPFFGDYERASPTEGDGFYVGSTVGYIDGVVEFQGTDGINQCVLSSNIAFCENPNDPLYPVRPDPDDDACNLPDSATDEACDGSGHEWNVDPYDPVGVDMPNPEPLHNGAPFVWPGTYSKYIYLFGAGGGPGVDEAPFADYLPETICHDYLEDVGEDAATADKFLPDGEAGCSLITPDDLTSFKDSNGVLDRAGISGDDHNGRTEQAAVCGFAPQFTVLTGDKDEIVCPGLSRYNEYKEACHEDSTAANCFNNKPGWYTSLGSIDQSGSLIPDDDTRTMDGNRDDVARINTYYMSPVPVTSSNWCAAPPVQTTAADGLDTGVVPDTSTDDPQDFKLASNPPQYLLGAHDVDMHLSPPQTVVAGEAVTTAFETADAVLEQVPGLPDTDALTDQANQAVDRAHPVTSPKAEPNADGDTTGQFTRDLTETNCPGDATTSLQPDGIQTASVGRIQAEVNGAVFAGTLHDYTLIDEDQPLPEETGEQRANPWAPNQYSFGGELQVFEDRNGNLTFDGCPAGQVPTTASPDICQVELPWDAYNSNANLDDGQTVGDFADEQGFADPLGLASVVKVTGPIAVDSLDDADMTENPPDSAASNVEDRWTVLPSTGQKCIVGFSKGLFDASSDLDGDGSSARARVASPSLLGTDDPEAAADDLCGGSADHVITDAYTDQTTLGDFGAGFNWVKLQPTPSEAPGADDDGLTVHAFLTVQQGGDEKTAANLGLGQDANGDNDITNDATVVEEWSDGSVTYQWTDHDPFQTERT